MYDLKVLDYIGLSPEKIIKESSIERQSTGNRVGVKDVFFSLIVSDAHLFFKYFSEKQALSYIQAKYENEALNNHLLKEEQGPKDLQVLNNGKKVGIFKEALKFILDLPKLKISTETRNILTKTYHLNQPTYEADLARKERPRKEIYQTAVL